MHQEEHEVATQPSSEQQDSQNTPPLPLNQQVSSPQQNKYLSGIALTSAIGGTGLLAISCFWLLLAVTGLAGGGGILPIQVWQGLLTIFILLGSTTCSGGILMFYHGARSLLQKESTPITLPGFWSLFCLFVALLLTGYGLSSSGLMNHYFPQAKTLIPLFIGTIPVIALIAFGTQRLSFSLPLFTWRRAAGALISGATFAIHLVGGLLLLATLYEGPYQVCFSPICAGTAEGTSGLIFLIFIVPLLEELIKPLLLLPFLHKVSRAAEAFFPGLLCGAGYGFIEAAFAIAIFPGDWALITLVTGGLIMLQGLCCGLVTLGWYQLFQRPIKPFSVLMPWVIALLIHMAIYASLALLFLTSAGIAFQSVIIVTIRSLNVPSLAIVMLVDMLLLVSGLWLSVQYLRNRG